ncbi:hypothetical protein RQP46_009870 [Phenoliferia psychrophenolica]
MKSPDAIEIPPTNTPPTSHPPPSLPPELLIVIIDQVASAASSSPFEAQRALHTLCLVSRDWYSVAKETHTLLYAIQDLESLDLTDMGPLHGLWMRHPNPLFTFPLRSLIFNITLQGDDSIDLFISLVTRCYSTLRSIVITSTSPFLLAAILPTLELAAPTLTTLILPFSEPTTFPPSTSSFLASLTSIETLVFPFDWIQPSIFHSLRHKTLRHLTVAHRQGPEYPKKDLYNMGVDNVNYRWLTSERGKGNNCDGLTDNAYPLQCRLRHLTFHLNGLLEYDGSHSFTFSRLLQSSCHTLTSLKIDALSDETYGDIGDDLLDLFTNTPFPAVNSLALVSPDGLLNELPALLPGLRTLSIRSFSGSDLVWPGGTTTECRWLRERDRGVRPMNLEELTLEPDYEQFDEFGDILSYIQPANIGDNFRLLNLKWACGDSLACEQGRELMDDCKARSITVVGTWGVVVMATIQSLPFELILAILDDDLLSLPVTLGLFVLENCPDLITLRVDYLGQENEGYDLLTSKQLKGPDVFLNELADNAKAVPCRLRHLTFRLSPSDDHTSRTFSPILRRSRLSLRSLKIDGLADGSCGHSLNALVDFFAQTSFPAVKTLTLVSPGASRGPYLVGELPRLLPGLTHLRIMEFNDEDLDLSRRTSLSSLLLEELTLDTGDWANTDPSPFFENILEYIQPANIGANFCRLNLLWTTNDRLELPDAIELMDDCEARSILVKTNDGYVDMLKPLGPMELEPERFARFEDWERRGHW